MRRVERIADITLPPILRNALSKGKLFHRGVPSFVQRQIPTLWVADSPTGFIARSNRD
jgi:hypothetical protein